MARWWPSRWWSSRRSERDFRDEIESHLALEAERQSAQRGLTADDARTAAHRAFGNVTHAQERFFDSARWAWAERAKRNLRLAFRALRRRPGFSIAAILTLTIGIGFNTAIFTVFYAIAFRALPVRDADRLVNVFEVFSGRYSRNVHGMESMVSYPEYASYQAMIDSTRGAGGALTSATAYAVAEFAFTESPSGALAGEYVTCSYFAAMGVRLAAGRGFLASDCAHPGDPAVAVLSHNEWTRDFGGDSSVIGRVVHVNSIPFTVVGVAEPGFTGIELLQSDIWVPVTMELAAAHGRDSLFVKDWSWLTMAARLAPGATIEQARTQLAVTALRRDRQLYPERVTHVAVEPGALLNFPEARQRGVLAVTLIGALGGLVVAMVCANLMNLLLARGIGRRREIGIRLAIGASRGRLVEQLLTESAVLAIVGGALGFVLANALPAVMTRVVPVAGLHINLAPDARVLLFTFIVSAVTAVAFGLVPALQSTSVDLVSASKGGMGGPGQHVRPSRLRAFVVGTQVAGSALLLIVSALFVRAAHFGATIDPGYATRDVTTFELNLPMLGYTASRTMQVYDALRDRIAAAPGVEAVSFASPLPLLGRTSNSVVPDEGTSSRDTLDDVSMVSASGDYVATMRIRLVAGRPYTDAEVRAAGRDNQPVVVNQSLARTLWQSGNPIGKGVHINGEHFVVVGVAADTRPISLATSTTPFLYRPGVPGGDRGLYIVVRASGSLGTVERRVPGWARELDPAIVVKTQRMSERLALELTPARLSSAVAGTMGALTLALALIGIYGVVNYSVSQRTRDIAVRLALGATERGVVRLMMQSGARAVVVGVAVGTAAALGVSQGIRGVLLGVSPLDPAAYVATAVVLLGAAAVAIYAPARRAARVNPAQTLRED